MQRTALHEHGYRALLGLHDRLAVQDVAVQRDLGRGPLAPGVEAFAVASRLLRLARGCGGGDEARFRGHDVLGLDAHCGECLGLGRGEDSGGVGRAARGGAKQSEGTDQQAKGKLSHAQMVAQIG